MAWSDLSPRHRAIARASIFFFIIVVVSMITNMSDEETAAVLRPADLLIATLGAAIYAGVMTLVDRRLIDRKKREQRNG